MEDEQVVTHVTKRSILARWLGRDFLPEGEVYAISQDFTKGRGKKRLWHFKPVQLIPWKYLTKRGRYLKKRYWKEYWEGH